MEPTLQHPDLLSADWPMAMVTGLAAVAGLGWVAAHVVTRRLRATWLLRWPLFVLRCGIGAIALWLAANVAARSLVLATSWSITGICIGTAVAVEAALALYAFERRFVTSRLGFVLAGLRVALVLLVAAMLLQPGFAWNTTFTHRRTIAVLVDSSQSMQLADRQMTDSEKLRLISVFEPSLGKPPYDLSAAVSELSPLPERLGAAAETLAQLPAGEAQQQFVLQRQRLKETLRTAQTVGGRQAQRIGDLLTTELPFSAATIESARQHQHRLETDVIARLVEAEQLIAEHAHNIGPVLPTLIDHLNGAAAALRETLRTLPSLIDEADRSFFASLPPEKMQAVEKLLAHSRADLARTLLLGDAPRQLPGVIEGIKGNYAVRVFGFARTTAELDVDRWSVPQEADETATPAVDDSQDSVTDLVRALETVQRQIPAEQLSGVLLLTDGQHNAGGDIEGEARRLGASEIPIVAVALGSSRPPVDAAILDVDAPPTVLVDDRLAVNARVRLTGMRGRSIRAKLVEEKEGKNQRELGDTLDEKEINVTNDDFTATVELSHTPSQEGFCNYRVVIEPVAPDVVESEAFTENNERALAVAVSDNRTEVLLLEGRPRWEFGYLRNLFAGRDVSVQLQTVLFEPQRLLAASERPAIHASASRPAEETEATRLPENEAEWMKFDVVILGDVGVDQLSSEQLAVLHKFISQRGGALIVIAGPRHMPHRYTGTPLAEMLPGEFEPSSEVLFNSPEESFRFHLTPAGERHAVMQQGDSVAASQAVWDSIPELYWRHPLVTTKPGSTVLAYAGNALAQRETGPQDGETPDAAEQRRKQHEEYVKQHALVVVRNFGAGRVMLVNTDRTWRFRYRVGDTYHHRFWGQVLRWAAAQKLQAGTQFVQLGTDRVTYAPGEPIQVTAKLTDPYFTPIDDPEAVVRVYRGDQVVVTRPLEPSADVPGTYQATLGELPEQGQFRLVLESPAAKRIFAGEHETVETRFAIDAPETRSPELLETTADRDALSRLASLSGGSLVEADGVLRVADYFAPGTQRYTQQHAITLWDSWPLLLMMILVVTVEWTARKTGGLV